MSTRCEVAVVGAGIAGAEVARHLHAAGLDVLVLEKARGPGGRCATRHGPDGGVDHGAQYFTVRDPGFAAILAERPVAAAVARWPARVGLWNGACLTPAPDPAGWVGCPGMSALPRALLDGVRCRFGARVVALVRDATGWRLALDDGQAVEAERVVLTAPAPQAEALVAPFSPELAARARSATLAPCWAVVVDVATPVELALDALRVDDGGPLAWCARNASKPRRTGGKAWVLHADAGWSEARLEQPAEAVAQWLQEAWHALLGSVGAAPVRSRIRFAHRWRFARVDAAAGGDCIWRGDIGLGLAGDWFVGPRVEDAWRSGRRLAERLLAD